MTLNSVYTKIRTPSAFLAKLQDSASTPTYSLSSSSSSVNEGSAATFTLTTKNVATSTSVPFTLSGISAADVLGGSLSGNAVVNSSGLATISVSLLSDLLTEGSETLTVTAGGATASILVNDTSLNSFTPNPSIPAKISLGTIAGKTLNLVNPIQFENGKVYYYLDANGDGKNSYVSGNTSTFYLDAVSHNYLDTLLNNGADTVDTQPNGAQWGVDDARTLKLGSIYIVLPTSSEMKVDFPFNAYFWSGGKRYSTSDSVVVANGTQPIWPTVGWDSANGFWLATPSVYGHDYTSQSPSGGGTGSNSIAGVDTFSSNFAIFQVLFDGVNYPSSVSLQTTAAYLLSAISSSVNEGSVASFNLTATNVASGTSVPYTISGISSADVSGGALSGNAVINSNGIATISVTLLNDNLTEGSETLTVTASGATASILINDTSTTPLSRYELEPNNSISQATLIAPSSSVTGQLSAANDIDFYLVSATAGGVFTYTFDAPTGTYWDYTVSLVNSSGAVIASTDTTTDKTLSAAVASAGDYYIKISSKYSSNYTSDPYLVSYSFSQGNIANGELEPNNSISQATLIAPSSSVTGQLSAANDIDFYLVSATAGGVFTYTFDAPTGTYWDYTVSLVNSSGAVIASTDTTTDKTLSAAVASAGDYYIKISSKYSSNYTSDPYLVSYSFSGNNISTIPTYSLRADTPNVNEGSVASFTLTTNNVAAGTVVPYTISGISSSDISSGALNGSTTVSSNGQATISVLLANDNLTEGAETLTVTASGASASAQINDTSRSASPTYSISTNWTSTSEGTPIVATLSTTNVAAGATLYYELSGSGITTSDFGGLSLTGSSVINSSGQASLTIPLSADTTTEGNETFVIQYYTDSGRSIAAGSAAYVTIQDTSKGAVTPTYAVSANTSSVNEGSTADFTITTSNVSAGTSIAYTLSGVTSSDITGGALTGFATVNSVGTATVSVPIAADNLTEGAETLTISLQGKTVSILINDTSKAAAVPTYSLAASSATVSEGSVATFTLTTTGVTPGTSVSYTISGVSASDVTGGLSGVATIDTNGLATISVPVAADFLTEGAETLTVTAQGKFASIEVSDTSKTTLVASYALSASTNSVSEGSSASFTLTTTNVAGGTSIPYTISGVSSADITGGGLSGVAVVSSNGTATISIPIASDQLTEGNETLTLTAQGISSIISIIDSSTSIGSTAGISVTRGSSNDLIQGSNNNDSIDGGAGTDTQLFTGNLSDYTITYNRALGAATVTDRRTSGDGIDSLVNIEKLQFLDRTIDLISPALSSTPSYGKTPSFLFDPVYYLLKNPELIPSVSLSAAYSNYIQTGAAAGEAPNNWFDSTYYASRWSDLKSLNLDAATLFSHYNLYGVWEGRSAGPMFDKFDGTRYLKENPDVAGYVDAYVKDFLGSRINGAIAHYIIYGANESRKAYDTTGQLIEQSFTVVTPTYNLTTLAPSVNEGSTASFNLTYVNATVGTEVGYTLSGINTADISTGTLLGKVIISSTGQSIINIPIASDTSTEGQETLTMTLKGISASTVINDTSKSPAIPTYTLTAGSSSVNEGDLTRVIINTTNVAPGTNLEYVISGTNITTSDLLGGLKGVTNVDASGLAFINLIVNNDQTTEGPETMFVTIGSSSTQIVINDTSVTLVGIPIDSGGGGGGDGGGGGGGGGGSG